MKKLFIPAIILLIFAAVLQLPRTMLSPGKLQAGHSEIVGDCFACHQPFAGVPNEKCLACHPAASIAINLPPPDINTQKPLFHKGLGDQKCTTCHLDHKGIDPSLTALKFSHGLLSQTTLSNCVNCHNKPDNQLHLQLSTDCKSCHTTASWENGSAFDHAMITGTDKTNCVSCHNKPDNQLHLQLSTQCSSCHTTAGWGAGVAFDHNMIQGADKNNCVLCHTKPADAFHVSTQDNCAKCHGSTQWLPSTFDHSSFFALDRKHNATCVTCHKTQDFAVYTCFGCHEHSENNIRAEHSEEGITNTTDCVRCHASSNEDDIRSIERNGNGLDTKEADRVKNYIKNQGGDGSGEGDD